MKKILLIAALALTNLVQAQTYNRCGTTEYQAELEKQNPWITKNREKIDRDAVEFAQSGAQDRNSQVVVTIPIVFHVIYSNATQNISNARINAQLERLNLDFAKMNSDTTLIPLAFRPVASNTQIQFCLAQQDPSGNATTGINRVSTTVTSWSQNNAVKSTAQGGQDAWNRNSYLNVWVCNLGGGLLGYAQFPGGAASTDGVVVLYSAVGGPGAVGTATPYHLGRTLTHEVGHWVNLRHTFENGCGGTTANNCLTGGDQVCDTPPTSTSNFGCPATQNTCTETAPFPPPYTSNQNDQTMNYMDYVDDACMYMFSAGQTVRITSCINGSRASLQTSIGCTPPSAAINANFSASATTIQVGNSVNFTDLSSNSPTSWSWTFTGGTPASSTVQNPSNIVYNTAGTYTVSLTATNATSNDTETKTSYITVTTAGGNPCDTVTNFPGTGTASVIGSSGWGYISGHNDYLDIAKAEKISGIAANSVIDGVYIAFGVATSSGPTNTFNVNIWDDNGTAGLPSTILGTETVTYQTAATDAGLGVPTYIDFNPDITVSGDIYAGIGLTYTAGDTLGIVTTADGEVTPGTGYEQFSGTDWHAYSETPASWGLNVAHLILAVVCTPTGINQIDANTTFSISPNPSNGLLTIDINSQIAQTINLKIVNLLGEVMLVEKIVANSQINKQLDLRGFANGIYQVMVETDGKTYVEKLVLNK
jgi:PKD repeat protein